MHFAGVYVRSLDQRSGWIERFKDLSVHHCYGYGETLSSGRVHLVADKRITRRASDALGVFVNTGSLIADRDASIAEARESSATLAAFLLRCRGNFVGAMVSADGEQVVLFADLLGTHPVYYAEVHGAVLFSTSLDIIRHLLDQKLSIDDDGLMATCVFGYPLGEKTPYREIRCIDAAQLVIVSASGVATKRHWDWRTVDVPEERDQESLADEVHAAFTEAVAIRDQPRARAILLLSGGMDSRMIAGTLASMGRRPPVLTLGYSKSLDAVLAERLSKALGCQFAFHEMPYSAARSGGGVGSIVHDFLAQREPCDSQVTRIWSGDGGSVGLGAVYLTPEVIEMAQGPARGTWIDRFAQDNKLEDPSSFLFATRLNVKGTVRRLIEQEVRRIDIIRSGQIPYRFLMLNDQRRHLHYLFELKMKVPIEFVTPFWDSQFLLKVLQCPEGPLLQHQFYSRIFQKLIPITRQVPWQTYPGHEPCPLPIPAGYDYQWGDGRARPGDAPRLRSMAKALFRALLRRSFPSGFIRRSAVAAASLSVLCRRDNSRAYLIEQARTVLEHVAPRTANL